MQPLAPALARDAAPASIEAGSRRRLESIDLLRGIVMILMALDHTRDFFGTAQSPTDVAHASAALFFTRWITHLCAPTFFLLAGTGAWLARRRRTTGALSRFLITRGLWLIALELTVVRCLGYQFNFDYRVTFLIILWALGWSMIALGCLVHLPTKAVAAFGLLTIALHDLLDPIRSSALGAFGPVWSILHAPGVVLATPAHVVFAAYPLVPWIGVTAAGYALGAVFDWEGERRRAFLLRAGIGMIAAFAVLRLANACGDPSRWTAQATTGRTILAFLNTTKYPPSLLYLLMTLGPALLILRAAESGAPRALRPALVFGRVPLFYFVLHLPLIHLVALGVCWERYRDVHWAFQSAALDQFPMARPPGWGYGLAVVYLVWILVVLALYPVSAWFARLKRRRTDPWLSYL